MHKKEGNCNVHTTIIIILLIIIAILGFFLGKNYNALFDKNNTTNEITTTSSETTITSDIIVKVIDDKRCIDCQTDSIMMQLKQLPVLANATFDKKDFGDEGIEEYLKENNINLLPAIIFGTGKIDENINPYLIETPSKEYSLQIGAKFNPFAKRSENGFLLLEKTKLDEIKNNSYVKGNPDAKVTWIEYSDLECPYCAKLHTSGTPEELVTKYGDDLSVIYNHFPLDFHQNAQSGAEILECIGEQKGSDGFYSILETSYAGRDITKAEDNTRQSSKEFLLEEAVKLGVDKTKIEKCLEDKTYAEKIKTQQQVGAETFGVTGTPGNVLINNETGEYEVISGAYPTASFEAIIDKFIK